MQTTVKADVVKARLTANRAKHQEIYNRAMAGYRAKAIEHLEDLLVKLRAGKTALLYFNDQLPEDHTKDYDVALDMVDSHEAPTMEVDEEAFRRLMRDEWRWRPQFMRSAAAYTDVDPEYLADDDD